MWIMTWVDLNSFNFTSSKGLKECVNELYTNEYVENISMLFEKGVFGYTTLQLGCCSINIGNIGHIVYDRSFFVQSEYSCKVL